jgi:hypothetical protein
MGYGKRMDPKRGKRVNSTEPPWLAESLLCIFARAKDVEALMGDFEELFARDCESGHLVAPRQGSILGAGAALDRTSGVAGL